MSAGRVGILRLRRNFIGMKMIEIGIETLIEIENSFTILSIFIEFSLEMQ